MLNVGSEGIGFDFQTFHSIAVDKLMLSRSIIHCWLKDDDALWLASNVSLCPGL